MKKYAIIFCYCLVFISLATYISCQLQKAENTTNPISGPCNCDSKGAMAKVGSFRDTVVIGAFDPDKRAPQQPTADIYIFRLFRETHDGQYPDLVDNKAYYTDNRVWIDVTFYPIVKVNGDTWKAVLHSPDGSVRQLWEITYHSFYEGELSCFVFDNGMVECDAVSMWIYTGVDVLCREKGEYTVKYYKGEFELITEASFTLIHQAEPSRLKAINQWAYPQQIGTSEWGTIQNQGCAITAASMMLYYHGIDITPAQLNTWLTNPVNDGYLGTHSLKWRKVCEYAEDEHGKLIEQFPFEDVDLSYVICMYGPQIVGIDHEKDREIDHFILAYGRPPNEDTYLILDPDGGDFTTLLDYNNDIDATKGFRAVTPGGSLDRSGLLIIIHSPAAPLLTYSSGNKTGFDPTNGVEYEEIPGSQYCEIEISDIENNHIGPHLREIDIVKPPTGNYELKVIGIEDGIYDVDILFYDTDNSETKRFIEDITIQTGEEHSYSFNYSKEPDTPIELIAFDGKGQRPRDVNKFLTYIQPTSGRIHLASGTTTYNMIMCYSPLVLPNTFSAVLNGNDISSIFSPQPGDVEVVEINLESGRNVLILSIKGTANNKISKDTDRLTFLVP